MINLIHYIDSKYHLKRALNYVMENNKKNFNPYHNFNHLFNTANYSYIIATEMNLNDEMTDNLIIASLFHDINHTGNIANLDDINIKIAIHSFSKFFDEIEIDYNYSIGDFNIDANLIKSLIKETEYPYIKPNERCSILEMIIRDADMCQIFQYDYIHSCILGLQEEHKVSLKSRIVNQIKFLKDLKFNTIYCKEIWSYSKQDKIDELEILNSTLNAY